MKISINVYISAVERLYNDGLLTDKEYKSIMDRIVSAKVSERSGDKNG